MSAFLLHNFELFLGVAALSALASMAMLYLAPRWGLIDHPNQRSAHHRPMPRAGGIGFVVVTLAIILVLTRLHLLSLPVALLLGLGGCVIAAVGLWDDRWSLAAHWRLLIHVLLAASILLTLQGLPVLDFGFALWHWQAWGWVISAGAIVWFINLYNFMDGIDGLAASEAIFVLLSAVILLIWQNHSAFTLLCLLIAAAVSGFLIVNWPPAKIFMGDVGSGFIGFILASIAVITVKDGLLSVWQWCILLSCFWVDATLTLMKRLSKRENLTVAHCAHLYQRLARHYGHRRVVMAEISVNIFIVLPIAMLAGHYPRMGFYLAVAVALLAALTWMIFYRRAR